MITSFGNLAIQIQYNELTVSKVEELMTSNMPQADIFILLGSTTRHQGVTCIPWSENRQLPPGHIGGCLQDDGIKRGIPLV